MKNDLKKIFFSSLLTVLFIVSNLICLKYTTFGEIIVSANFITYPFIILCLLILLDTYGKKETYYTIISTVFIQIFILLSYSLVVSLKSQQIIPDLTNSINEVFFVNEVPLIASVIAFMISNYITVYLFVFFDKKGKKSIGVILGTILSLVVYDLIYIIICYYNIEKEILFNLLVSHLFISFVMSIVVIVLFYILKERVYIYTTDDKEIADIKYKSKQEILDKTVLEVITLKEKPKVTKKESINTNKQIIKNNKSDKLVNVKKTKAGVCNLNKKVNSSVKSNKNKDK